VIVNKFKNSSKTLFILISINYIFIKKLVIMEKND